MKPFTTVTSRIIPLPRKDVDTDLIIPAQFLTSTSKGGYGTNLFRRLKDTEPNFPLNLAEYKGAEILIADSNFGCGSSREHAVWALVEAGIRVVIAPSFADIFFGNSAKNGLLLVTLSQENITSLLSRAEKEPVSLTVDLHSQTVLGVGIDATFDYDAFRKHCLLQGHDDIDYLISHKSAIESYFKSQESTRFMRTTQE